MSAAARGAHETGHASPARWLLSHWDAAISLGILLTTVVLGMGLLLGIFERPLLHPFAVVNGFYQAAADDDYQRARSFLTSEASLGYPEPRLRQEVTPILQGRPIDKIGLAHTDFEGDQAVVGSIIWFQDGTIDVRLHTLEREGGRWRLRWPPD